MILTNPTINGILLGSDRGTDFLLSDNKAQSRSEKLNRFSIADRNVPFLLGDTMNKYYPTIYVNKKQWRTHRYVMENYIGRKLLSSELVHHKDDNRNNNRIENLEIVSRSEHMKIHPQIGKKTRWKQIYFFQKWKLRKMRDNGFSTHQIAKIYGCSQPTIWGALKKLCLK